MSILIYHRVLRDDDALNTWDVTAAQFDVQMRALATHFSTLPLSEAIDRLAAGDLPPRAACVTFDDGYADNPEVALPILVRHAIPATFFVATGYLNGERMWNDTVIEAIRRMPGAYLNLDDWGLGTLSLEGSVARRAVIQRVLPALKYLPSAERESRASRLAEQAGLARDSDLMMTIEHLRALQAANMEIGAHTITHPILANASSDEARREINDSGRYLADALRTPIRLFAYPNGRPKKDYGEQHVRMVREAGYSAAVSTSPGTAKAGSDVFQLPRFTPWDRTSTKFVLRLARNIVNGRAETV